MADAVLSRLGDASASDVLQGLGDASEHAGTSADASVGGVPPASSVGNVPGILHQDLHPDGNPRRPMNAFMIFARHRRPDIQKREPGLKTGEISKRLSHDWKHLSKVCHCALLHVLRSWLILTMSSRRA